MLYKFLLKFVSFFLKPLYRVKAVNAQKQPEKGPYVICANHISILDAIFIAFYIKQPITFMAKVEIFSWPVLKHIFKKLGVVPINRDGNDFMALKTAVRVLKGGNIIMILPQGKRCRGKLPETTEFKDGAAFMSYFTKAPILPVGITARNHWIKPFRRTVVSFGDPIAYDSVSGCGSKEEFFAKLDSMLESSICSLVNEQYAEYFGEKK